MIAGRHSRTGRPILANDPHLALTAPAMFYQNEIRTPGFSAIGGSLPGAPFVIIGNTERFAWGVTTHRMDVTDVYQEQIVPDPKSPSGLSTMYRGQGRARAGTAPGVPRQHSRRWRPEQRRHGALRVARFPRPY